jgi:predicted MFS family arabinose efflux permease
VNEGLISRMLQATLRLYKNAYSGIPRSIWWLSFVILVNRSGTMVIPFLTVYLVQLGYTLTEAGFVMATFGIGAILGAYLGGRLTDRFGFFWIQVTSLLLNGLLFIVLSRMQSLWQIAGCIFVLSSLGEAFRPANAAAIAAFSDEINRTRAYSLNRLAVNLGWAIGPALGGLLASVSYELLFWVDGLTCITASGLLYLIFKNRAHGVQEEKKTIPKGLNNSAYKDRVFLQGMIFLLLIGICFFQLSSILPVYYKEQVQLSEAMIGAVLAFNGLLIVLFEMVLVYKLEQRRTSTLYMFLGSLMIGISFLVLLIAPLVAVVLMGMIVITFGEMLLFPFTNNFWVSRTNSSNRGQYAALYTMTFSLSLVLAPVLSSRVALHYGFDTLFIADFLLCTLAAFGFVWLQKQLKMQQNNLF